MPFFHERDASVGGGRGDEQEAKPIAVKQEGEGGDRRLYSDHQHNRHRTLNREVTTRHFGGRSLLGGTRINYSLIYEASDEWWLEGLPRTRLDGG